jgi:hypothetical protein
VRGLHPKTTTTTVVQIQTVAPPPPVSRELTAILQGQDGTCLSATSHADMTSDTFTLRRPGNGLTNGDVIGVADGSQMDDTGCNLSVTFGISPSLGFFVVSDDNSGSAWGPFDSHQLAKREWTVRLNAGS